MEYDLVIALDEKYELNLLRPNRVFAEQAHNTTNHQ